jgi:hypothetical protein
MEEWSPKLSASEDGSTGGKDIRAWRPPAGGLAWNESVGIAMNLEGTFDYRRLKLLKY